MELEFKPRELSSKPRELETKPRKLSSEIQKLLDELGGKSKREDLHGAVFALLKWREMQLSELAGYLGRNAEYIRQNYLVELIQAGIIRQSNPEKPSDPKQSYRASVIMKNYDEL